jgi:hypothetical protein
VAQGLVERRGQASCTAKADATIFPLRKHCLGRESKSCAGLSFNNETGHERNELIMRMFDQQRTRRNEKGHWRKKRRSSRFVEQRIPAEGAWWPLCYKALHFPHFLNGINGKIGVELLADGAGLVNGESDVSKRVITLVPAAEAMADELTLYWLDGLDDVVRAGICHMLLSLLRRCSINEKLALAAIAGVSAEDGIGGHWSWGGGAASLPMS